MKLWGIARKVDNLGRIVIPMEIRKAMDIKEGDILEINQDNKMLILKKYYTKCVFCGNDEGISKLKGIGVCDECRKKIKDNIK